MAASYEERIRQARQQLSPSFIRLADFLLDSYTHAAFLTATELAHKLDVDPATVVRFAQRLGYAGYPQLQREIRQRVRRELLDERPAQDGEHPAEAALAEVTRAMELTRRGFDKKDAQRFINALDKATRIVVLAEGMALPAAQSLVCWLEAAGYTIHLARSGPADLARAVVGVRKGDLVIALEAAQETQLIARALQEARAAKASTAAIVTAPSARAARHAELVLATHASSDSGMGQVMLQAIVYALVRMLAEVRPGRFGEVDARVRAMARRLASGGRDGRASGRGRR